MEITSFFPRLEQYRFFSLLLSKPIYVKEKDVIINQGNTADYVTLAQSDMMKTFIWGVSTAGMVDVHSIFLKRLDEFEDKMRKADKLAKLDQIKTEVETDFREGVVGYFHEKHQVPIRRVIGNLPIDELAELAETLVFIESLKERVTSEEQSVSGPIDVAVISKGDGFIWIKRKHYFKPELNPRFFVRNQIRE